MAQIHCYIPDDIAEQLRRKAEQEHLSTSKYLAKLIKREVGNQWPEGYFENIGPWEGEPLVRPPQGELQERMELN